MRSKVRKIKDLNVEREQKELQKSNQKQGHDEDCARQLKSLLKLKRIDDPMTSLLRTLGGLGGRPLVGDQRVMAKRIVRSKLDKLISLVANCDLQI